MNHPPLMPSVVRALFAVCFLLPGAARAGPAGAVKIRAAFAAGESLRGRRAAALAVDVENDGPGFAGELRYRPEGGLRSRRHPVTIPPNSRRRYFLPFAPGPPGSLKGDLALFGPEGTSLDRLAVQGRVSGCHCLLGVVGKRFDAGLKETIFPKDFRALNRRVAFDAKDLPDLWEGLDPYDVLVVRSSTYRNLSATRQEALRNWVLRGGALVACADMQADVWRNSFAAVALDLEMSAPVNEAGSRSLQRWARSKTAPGVFRRVPASAGRGETLVFQGGGPRNHLVSRVPYGRGMILFLAFDPSQAGLSEWKGRPLFFRRLLASWLASGLERAGEPAWRGAEASIAAVLKKRGAPHPPVLIVMLAVLGYAAVIGPVEYVVWKRLRRPHWTMVSFPLVVFLATAAAVWSVGEMKGKVTTLMEITVEDVDPCSGDAVFETYAGVYSPMPAEVDLVSRRDGFLSEFLPPRLLFAADKDLPCTFRPEGRLRARIHVGGTRFFRDAGIVNRVVPPLAVRIQKTEIVDEDWRHIETAYRVEVRNGFDRPLERMAVYSGPFGPLGPSVLVLSGSVDPHETKVFGSEGTTVIEKEIHQVLDDLQDGDGTAPDTVLPFLSFCRPAGQKIENQENIRRGLHLGDALHKGGEVFFTGWIEEDEAVFSAPDRRTRTVLKRRWIRMRVTKKVTFEQKVIPGRRGS